MQRMRARQQVGDFIVGIKQVEPRITPLNDGREETATRVDLSTGHERPSSLSMSRRMRMITSDWTIFPAESSRSHNTTAATSPHRQWTFR